MSRRRALSIVATVCRHRLDTLINHELADQFAAPRWLRLLCRFGPQQLIPIREPDVGTRLRAALQELGPVYIKLGQLLSTRPDVVGEELAGELANLQDAVPPFETALAKARVEAALGNPLDEVFATFEDTPLAAASIAQVHAATLQGGDEVVVKIVRPGLEKRIAPDIELARSLAQRLEQRSDFARRAHLVQIVDDYETTILAELDMRQEASNTEQLRRNFADSDMLYVPRVYHDLNHANVLVLERIHALPISRISAHATPEVDLKLLAERGVQTFFTQVFEHNFFHADMHPGNVFVDIDDPSDPSYVALDCAIIGTLPRADRLYLARNLVAFFNRRYDEVARLHLQSGWVPPETDADAFEAVIREVCDPLFEKPLAEISFAEFMAKLLDTAAAFEMEVQPQLILLQKTLLYVEGLGRSLYPALDLWETGKPFIEQWVADQISPRAQLSTLAERAPEIIDLLPRLPELWLDQHQAVTRLTQVSQAQQNLIANLSRDVAVLTRRRRRANIAGAALVAAAVAIPLLFGTTLAPVALVSGITGSVILLRA